MQLKRVSDDKIPSHLMELGTNRHLNPADPLDSKIIEENILRENQIKKDRSFHSMGRSRFFIGILILSFLIILTIAWASFMFRYQISGVSKNERYRLDRWTGEVTSLRRSSF